MLLNIFLVLYVFNLFVRMESTIPYSRKMLETRDIHVVIARDGGSFIDVWSKMCVAPDVLMSHAQSEAQRAVQRCMSIEKPTLVEFVLPLTERGGFVSLVRSAVVPHVPDEQFTPLKDLKNTTLFNEARTVLKPWALTAGMPPGSC